jgi:hypothetical protein
VRATRAARAEASAGGQQHDTDVDVMRRENTQICDASEGGAGLAFLHAQSASGATVHLGRVKCQCILICDSR